MQFHIYYPGFDFNPHNSMRQAGLVYGLSKVMQPVSKACVQTQVFKFKVFSMGLGFLLQSTAARRPACQAVWLRQQIPAHNPLAQRWTLWTQPHLLPHRTSTGMCPVSVGSVSELFHICKSKRCRVFQVYVFRGMENRVGWMLKNQRKGTKPSTYERDVGRWSENRLLFPPE